jgi:hypothetical protein
MKRTVSTLAAACLFSSIAAAGQDTLPQIVQRQQGRVEVIVEREFSPVDLRELARDCDLIGRVVVLDDGRGRLSKDERDIVSEYTVQVLDQFSSRVTLQPAAKLVISKPGGTMTIGGYVITSSDGDFPPLKAGEEYILFLRLDRTTGQYVVAYGAQGAFRNVGGEVEQVSQDTGTWNRERGRVPIAAFTQELADILASR